MRPELKQKLQNLHDQANQIDRTADELSRRLGEITNTTRHALSGVKTQLAQLVHDQKSLRSAILALLDDLDAADAVEIKNS